MTSDNETPKVTMPYLSEAEHEKLSATIDTLSRNSMIRFEIMAKRSEGMTVHEACQELAEEVNLAPKYIENIYYKR